MADTLHVVSHTHWDREWYLPHEVFRLRLVRLMDNLLDLLERDPRFVHFSLDGQTILLEDYLEIRPEARAKIEEHIRSGRVAIGPWYQLNDEFLVSGEATIRSLLIGTRVAQSFGSVMPVGYLPDQFGNISQMPQILRGFGLDNAIMGRGRQLREDSKMEFWWEAPDGSRVLGSLMALWYNNAQYLPGDPDGAVTFLVNLRDAMRIRSASSHLLLMNGVDHLEPLPWVGKTLAAVAERLHTEYDIEVRHSSLEEYVAALRAEVEECSIPLEVVRGELRDDRWGACLAGTLSTRVYLKQANDHAQTALERFAEPLSAMSHLMGRPYPRQELRFAWKLLMQNHPHDSICGCSVDQVHDEMMPRFQRVEQVARFLQEEALDTLTGRDRTRGAMALPCSLYVFNTLNWARTDPVTAVLEIPLGAPDRVRPQRNPDAEVRGLRIVDSAGQAVDFELVSNATDLLTIASPMDLPHYQWVQRIIVRFIAVDVPPCGYREYRVEAANEWPSAELPWEEPDDELYLDLEDVGDVGDEYLHRSPANDMRVEMCLGMAETWSTQSSTVRRTKVTRQCLDLPKTSHSNGRSEELVPCPVTVEHTVWRGVPRHEYRLTIDNRAQDHRLRLLVDAAGERVWAATPLDVVERPPRPPKEMVGASPFFPFTLWLSAQHPVDENRSVTVVAPGLHEYEAYLDGSGHIEQIGVTLLRCVGQLSGRGDGPGLATPGAQCPGVHTFDVAVIASDGDWKSGEVWKQAYQFATPLLTVQAPAAENVPSSCSFLKIEPSCLVLSAFKQAEDRETLIVRLFNTTDDAVEQAHVMLSGARQWRRVNLNEEPLAEWEAGEVATFPVRGKEIVTVEFEV